MTYKTFALKIARQAGKIIKRDFQIGMHKEWKADGSPVTKTDKAVNKLVISQVKKYFPGHDILGEEESFRPNRGEFVWVCDPVDGTVPFSHGMATFAFSLALVKNGAPILGVIYDPIMDRMYWAEKNHGAFLNDKKIKVNKLGLKNSFAVWDVKTTSQAHRRYPNVFWLNPYSVCYVGALIASGHAVATFYDYVYAHDIAALKVIVEEAGGKVTDRYGKEQRYDEKINGALITNGKVHKELLNFIKFCKS